MELMHIYCTVSNIRTYCISTLRLWFLLGRVEQTVAVTLFLKLHRLEVVRNTETASGETASGARAALEEYGVASGMKD